MKTQSQAEVKASKRHHPTPSQKRKVHAPLPITASPWSPIAVLAADPLGRRTFFELELDWISDTMEPELHQGDLARVSVRKDMTPCINELVLGLLKNGSLAFGAFCSTGDEKLVRIAFINFRYPSVYYRETDFQWLLPVECISQFDETHVWRRIIKTIEFEAGDDRVTRRGLAAA